jgi:hypothetical protein
MAIIDKIVDVNISKESMAVSVASFGIPLILTPDSVKSGSGFTTVKRYGSIKDVAEDWDATSNAYSAAQSIFGQQPKVTELLIGKINRQAINDSIEAIRLEADDWYCAIPVGEWDNGTENLETDGTALITLMDYIQASNKICIAQTSDLATFTANETTSLAARYAAKGYTRNALIWHKKTTAPAGETATQEWANAAWAGRVLPYSPGAATWAFKTLAGITVDNINSTQLQNATNKKVNVYMSVGGVSITHDGRTAGEWIDITIGIDFMHARIQERIFGMLAGTAKIPYNDVGISFIGSALFSVLNLAAQQQIIEASSIDISLPAYADLQAAQPAQIEARKLPDVHFSATFIGAVHGVTINGTVSI